MLIDIHFPEELVEPVLDSWLRGLSLDSSGSAAVGADSNKILNSIQNLSEKFALILDNNNNSMYNMSKMLLLKIYNDIYPDINPFIEYAPHWRKLIVYGGDLTIEKFRNSFNKIEYKNHGTINPRFKSLGVLFEEKLKL